MLKTKAQELLKKDLRIGTPQRKDKRAELLEMSEPTPLFFRIVDGPQRGTRIPVRDGVTIGRKDGDLLIRDPKMSVRHAQVHWRENEWVLTDLGSSNKIKVDGDRFDEVVLYSGLVFVVGSTTIEVFERPVAAQIKPETGEQESSENFTGSAIQVPAEALTWKELLTGLIDRARKAPLGERAPIRPLPMVVRLEFLSGPQHGTVWTIGYGPRTIGQNPFDLGLVDAAAELPNGQSCFTINSSSGRVVLTAAAEAPLRLNGKKPSSEAVELHSGDRIEIGKTRIRVILE
ncbi:MAG: FHA domain-containing protein [Bdellovibrionaceae bacterium]|nr:FHA domain-containing protein [Pseudobdellovibrionaceae bacterium]